MTADEVRKHVRTYITIFVALLFLTVVTVAVSYLKLTTGPAVVLAMIVASIKGSLVALYFMHLSNEKKIIYWTIALTGILFLFLMTIGFY